MDRQRQRRRHLSTADEFRFVSRQVFGDFVAVARVASIEDLDRWVKAGLMIRQDLSAGARHVSIFATPRTERGIAFQANVSPTTGRFH